MGYMPVLWSFLLKYYIKIVIVKCKCRVQWGKDHNQKGVNVRKVFKFQLWQPLWTPSFSSFDLVSLPLAVLEARLVNQNVSLKSKISTCKSDHLEVPRVICYYSLNGATQYGL